MPLKQGEGAKLSAKHGTAGFNGGPEVAAAAGLQGLVVACCCVFPPAGGPGTGPGEGFCAVVRPVLHS